MTLIRGLKKVFTRYDRFSSPHHYRLTIKERDSVTIFFAVISITIIGGSILLFIH